MTLPHIVATRRAMLAMSQRELAEKVGRSESWVSQVERGVLPVERMPVLRKLAAALDITVDELRGVEATHAEPVTNLPLSRSSLTGHPAPAHVYDRGSDHSRPPGQATDLETALQDVWGAIHQHDYASLDKELADLVSAAEGLRRNAPELADLTGRIYQAAAAAFSSLGEADAAWLSSERAMSLAEAAGTPDQVVASLFRMAHAFLRLERHDQALTTARTGIEALEPLDEVTPAQISLKGALLLVGSIAAARAGERKTAHRMLEGARKAACDNGERNDFETEFGPTNVELHEVAVCIELLDFGRALEVASKIDASGLSPERQARLLVDIARANHALQRHTQAAEALDQAAEISPGLTEGHPLAIRLRADLQASMRR